MHEYSIVQALIEQCEEYAHLHNACKITEVMIKIGRYSGVEIELLKRAFETFRESGICHDALLSVEEDEGDEMVLIRLEMEG